LRDLLAREPIISLVEAVLGPDCHLIANNVLCNPPGKAVDTFHCDDDVFFPLPPDIPRHDPRLSIPALAMHVFIPLTDITAEEFGPLQYVPGSHYAGRHPNDPQNPTFEGRSKQSLLAKAGDVYVQHPQVWHRGAPNSSDRTRYVYSQAFGRRVYAQRFYPSLKYQMPDWVLEGASERVQRILGIHARGPYE